MTSCLAATTLDILMHTRYLKVGVTHKLGVAQCNKDYMYLVLLPHLLSSERIPFACHAIPPSAGK